MLFLPILLTLLPSSVSAYNCLVARQQSVKTPSTLTAWKGCLDRWQRPDATANGSTLAAGQLKRCGGRTWFSNLHEWHSIDGCLATCSACLASAIAVGADAATCYERAHLAPYAARCMLGYNPKPRTAMKLSICNEPDATHRACHVNPFIAGGHYHDLAAPGRAEPALGEVVDIGCTLQRGVCMNWPLNGMVPPYVPLGGTETPGDKREEGHNATWPWEREYEGEWAA